MSLLENIGHFFGGDDGKGNYQEGLSSSPLVMAWMVVARNLYTGGQQGSAPRNTPQ